MQFEVKVHDSDTKARAGIITTDHGQIETPIFMPVGTAGTVKGMSQRNLTDKYARLSEQEFAYIYLDEWH